MAEKGTYELYTGPQSAYGHDLSDTSYDDTKKQDRSDARKRQAMKAYSYISRVDGVVQLHATWTECEARVKGVKGARFQKTLNQTDEKVVRAKYEAGE